MSDPIKWLSEDETKRIALNFAMTRGDKGFTAEELSGVLNEFIRSRSESALLDKIISGDLKCDWDGSEILMSLADKHVKPNQ